MSTWEERMSAAHKTETVPDIEQLRAENALKFPREKAEQVALDGCSEVPACYEAKPDGDTGRWLAFRVCANDCSHEHHRDEVWLAS